MESGRTFRVLNILDDSNREAVAQEISMSMPAERVISIMEKVIFINGKPECIRTDNGPEFISEKFNVWCQANGIKHKYIQPGKPPQNSYVERFNGSYRRAILDAYIFAISKRSVNLRRCGGLITMSEGHMRHLAI